MINKTFALTGLILSCLFMTVSVQAQNKLKFKPDGKFKIVQMTDIRLEVVQNFSQLYPCFLAVNRLDRVCQLAQFAAAVEVHI